MSSSKILFQLISPWSKTANMLLYVQQKINEDKQIIKKTDKIIRTISVLFLLYKKS